MNILFIHPTCPGQFEYLVPYIAAEPAMNVVFLCKKIAKRLPVGIRIKRYYADRTGVAPFEADIREAEGVYWAIRELLEESFCPDIIVGHTGWGGLLYVRAACPKARVVGYFEWYYRMLPEFEGVWYVGRKPEEIHVILTQRNASLLAQLETCDDAFTPTRWQWQGFPEVYGGKLSVIHEGVDTDFFSTEFSEIKTIPENKKKNYYRNRLSERCFGVAPGLYDAEYIVTCVSRGLEPTRCFPQFMDAVRELLKRQPGLHVVIAGDDRTFYGPKPKEKSWKERETEKGGFDSSRVHFVGWLSMEDFRLFLKASDVHVYMTIPYVLSWSALQAMSAGCCVAANASQPATEVIEDNVNGLLFQDGSPEGIADRVEEALLDEELRKKLGRAAQATVLERYCLEDCLRKQKELLFG